MIAKIFNLFVGRMQDEPKQESNPKAALHSQISELAYRKWQTAGGPAGEDEKFWLDAEMEILDKN
jgi:hypothetical protein